MPSSNWLDVLAFSLAITCFLLCGINENFFIGCLIFGMIFLFN